MVQDIVNSINNGSIDINNQQNFFATLIKGLLIKLGEEISIRNLPIPHIILHTGDDTLYVENKNKDYSAESIQVTNENYIYNTIPRCMVTPGGIDFVTDQLTSPTALGQLQLDYEDNIYELVGEFRRMPIKMGFELIYYTDTFSDVLELIQQMASKLMFIRTYNIVYMGKTINCSYKIPESMQGEWMVEVDGNTQDSRNRKISLNIEVESNIPIYDHRTIMDSSKYITNSGVRLDAHRYNGIAEKSPHEIIN